MKWAEIQVETTAQAQDAITNLMMDNGCGGTVTEGEAPVVIRCYLPVDDRLEDRLLSIKARINELPGFGLEPGSRDVTVKYAEDQDWAETWKQYFHTTRVGKRFVIKPVWEEYERKQGDIVIEMDPGMAFGTGYHPTTQLCLKMLEKYMRPRASVVDFGTGSGILAIAAAKMRASLVIAFDMDEVAVQAARENVIRNDVQEVIEVHRTDNPKFISLRVDIVLANLIADVIIANADALSNLLRPGGILIASGVVRERKMEVGQALRSVGFDIIEAPRDGEWVAIIAHRAE